ncbi:hemerythrin domain-containing protein [Kistimonas scapharcae]|uniref:Hemerythrin domain-containing protein n=1 Tax=Kistimonas scapharcae TaxID=1036133 RepID=A0ABP8V403_9GAMM
MSRLLDRLTNDHKHLKCLLDRLDQEMAYYSQDESRSPKLSVILDALDYIRTWPEKFHHPLEDRVFSIMHARSTDPELRDVIDRVVAQHETLEALTQKLDADFNAIVNDQVVPIETVMKDYLRYIDLQLEHLECENQFILPRIDTCLLPEDIAMIDKELDDQQREMGLQQLRNEYAELYHFIVDDQKDIPQPV